MFYHFYLQVCLEGQISRKSAIKSLSDGRQPFGDQIPWKFCEQFQDTVFPTLSGARIVRIATHPSAMRVILCFVHAKLSFLGRFSLDLVKRSSLFLSPFAAWIWFSCSGTFN